MTPRHIFYSLLLVLPLLIVTGCDNKPTQTRQASTQDNATLQVTVSEALLRDTLLSQSAITVVAQQGQITLSGIVAALEEKNRAGDIAKNIVGVTSVNNNLDIVTPTSTN